eukprot:1071343-Prorocentrum_minimum.AAC.2
MLNNSYKVINLAAPITTTRQLSNIIFSRTPAATAAKVNRRNGRSSDATGGRKLRLSAGKRRAN